MYILFEEHQYESRFVEKVLKDIESYVPNEPLFTTAKDVMNYRRSL